MQRVIKFAATKKSLPPTHTTTFIFVVEQHRYIMDLLSDIKNWKLMIWGKGSAMNADRDPDNYFDENVFGMDNTNTAPRAAQLKKNNFVNKLLEHSNILDAAHSADLKLHTSAINCEKDLIWLVYDADHNVRIAVLLNLKRNEIGFVRGWVSSHKKRDSLYDADWKALDRMVPWIRAR